MKPDLPPSRPMTTVERAISLRGVDAFRGVPMEQLAHVAAVSREERFTEGCLLFEEGNPPGGLYVILDGRVRLDRGGVPFGEAVAGEALGTWSLFDDHPRRATAVVVDEARVLVLERHDFYEVLAEHAEITRSLVQDLVARLLELSGWEDGEER
jgi:CRP-like cAMP-binding protein